MSATDLGYRVLAVLMILAGFRALLTNGLSLPLWSISGWQAIASGILMLVLGTVLAFHSFRRSRDARNRRDVE